MVDALLLVPLVKDSGMWHLGLSPVLVEGHCIFPSHENRATPGELGAITPTGAQWVRALTWFTALRMYLRLSQSAPGREVIFLVHSYK